MSCDDIMIYQHIITYFTHVKAFLILQFSSILDYNAMRVIAELVDNSAVAH